MSDIALPENRPGLEWVASIPAEWVTPTERLLLIALALDSFDGYSCAPGRDALMTFCGVRHVRTFQRLRDSLTKPNAERPALVSADIVNGRHTRYRMLRPVSESLSGDDSKPLSGSPDLSAVPDSESLSGTKRPTTEQPDARPVSTTCQHDLSAVPDSESLSHPSLPLPTLREGEREGEALDAPPQGGARPRVPVATVREIVAAVIPEPAREGGINCGNFDLGDAVTAVLASGWTVDALTVALADMGKPKTSATGQAIARLRALADQDPEHVLMPAADIGNFPEDTTPAAATEPRRTPTPPPVAEVLADYAEPEPFDLPEFTPPPGRPPRKPRPRPRGFDQAARDADAAEKQRQLEALRRLEQENPA